MSLSHASVGGHRSRLRKAVRPEHEAGRERVDTLVRIFEELVRGIGVVKSFGIEPGQSDGLLEANAGCATRRGAFSSGSPR
ncbi:MAG: hypothetical protein R3F19_15050 [Verrucomicrobiales bacterium]